jgi:hypothetical protein
MALPLMTLILIHFGSYLLVMRSSMLETLKDDYIITARAKGLDEKTIRDRHAAPNAALPVVTSVGLSLAFSINGGALTETVFTWPGLGRELVFSVSHADYPWLRPLFAHRHRGAGGQPGRGRALRLPGSEDTVLIWTTPLPHNPDRKAHLACRSASASPTG